MALAVPAGVGVVSAQALCMSIMRCKLKKIKHNTHTPTEKEFE
jgi:hypothetical protein